MTCIVGVVENGKVYMGGDSAGVANYHLQVRADAKVFTNGPCVFGFTSSFRMGQLLRYRLAVPPYDPDQDLDHYMTVTFIDAVRDCLKVGGYASRSDEHETGGTFLVGIAGHLFQIEDDYQVGCSLDTYDAVGCGRDVALGSLYTTPHLSPHERLTLALSAAERHCAGVRGPFTIVEGGEALKAPPSKHNTK